MSLLIATLNVQGMTDYIKPECIVEWMTRRKIDILCLQETYATPTSALDWPRNFVRHRLFHSYGTNHS